MADNEAQTPVDDNTPPQVAGEVPPDPNIVGNLIPQEIGMLNQLRQQGNTLTTRIGLAELQKAKLLWQIQQIEDKAQEIMDAAGKRMGIPNGQVWQVTQDGKARLMAQPGLPPAGVPLQAVPPVGEQKEG